MTTATMNLHRTARELYDALPVEEEASGGHVWKTIEADGVHITFFPEAATPSPEAPE